jgi:hypothetical protein
LEVFLTVKFVKKLSKTFIASGIQGSEIRDLEKTYSGSQIRIHWSKKRCILDPGNGTATLLLVWNGVKYAIRYQF